MYSCDNEGGLTFAVIEVVDGRLIEAREVRSDAKIESRCAVGFRRRAARFAAGSSQVNSKQSKKWGQNKI